MTADIRGSAPEILHAKYGKKSYEIPAMWMIGFCRNGRTALDAIKWWHYQAEAEKTRNV